MKGKACDLQRRVNTEDKRATFVEKQNTALFWESFAAATRVARVSGLNAFVTLGMARGFMRVSDADSVTAVEHPRAFKKVQKISIVNDCTALSTLQLP